MIYNFSILKREIKSQLKRLKTSKTFNHKFYGKCYYPLYNKDVCFSYEIPKVFSEQGDELEFFFVRDIQSAHSPYMQSKYFLVDRYNFGLDTHLYSHRTMLEQMGKPKFKYGYLSESEAILPDDYKIFYKNRGLEKDFDAIFTQSYDILNSIPNAKFVPFCSRLWFGDKSHGGTFDSNAYKKKIKSISILSSNLHMCDMHNFRFNLAMKCKREALADTYGTFDGGVSVKLAETLTDYRYTIAIENDIKPYWFTERITSAFAAMTVPIYCGASKIGDFFNEDGIIIIKPTDLDNIDKILAQCTEKEYESRLPAILDNYERAKQYINPADYMFEKYLKNRSK